MLEDCRNMIFGIAQHCAVYAVMFYTSEQLYAHMYAHLHAKHVDMFSIFFQLTCANHSESVLFTFRDSQCACFQCVYICTYIFTTVYL